MAGKKTTMQATTANPPQPETKPGKGVLSSYRFSARTDERIARVVERFGLTRTAALEAGIALLAEALDKPSTRQAGAAIESAKNPK